MYDESEIRKLIAEVVRETAKDRRVAAVTIHYEEKYCGNYGSNVEVYPRVRIEYTQEG